MNAMGWLLYLVGLIGGGALAVQAGVNAQLARGVGHPILAGGISFFSGMIGIWSLIWLAGIPFPEPAVAMARVPWFAWVFGGLLGATYLCINIWLVPQLGTASVVILAIGGQVLAALIIDHWGLLKVPQHTVTPTRLVGAALVLVGVWLVVKR